jgi:aspartyl-tRNA(Asn)/glutamyl-tRNA(Gln) amidotransferase subunit C
MPRLLTAADVAHIAGLAHLELSADEADLLGRQLTDILSFAAQIREVDTAEVAPMAPPAADAGHLRADDTRPCLGRDEALANAPAPDAGRRYFTVPRVIG